MEGTFTELSVCGHLQTGQRALRHHVARPNGQAEGCQPRGSMNLERAYKPSMLGGTSLQPLPKSVHHGQ